MSAIRLISASIDPTPTPEVESQSISLVPISRLALSNRATSRSDTAYPDDSFVWTASAGSDGSFTFCAVPRKQSGSEEASNHWDGEFSNSSWNTQLLRNAAAEYSLTANLPPPMYGSGYGDTGTLVNVYA